MYLSQTIHVNLTQENADILKRPSKVFNKIKAIFSGGMTPTEQNQAEVMLSVLQRLNIALRKSKFDDLVSIAANENLLYEGSEDASSNLNESNTVLANNFESGGITKVNTLALTVDAERENLRYLIHVNIVRKPKADATPVTIQVYGFINEFKQLPDESADAFSQRVKALIESSWGGKKDQDERLAALEMEFQQEVLNLQHQIDQLFPAKSTLDNSQRKVKREAFKSRYSHHNNRYNECYAYLPFFYLYGLSDDHDFIVEEQDAWDNDIAFNDNESDKSSGWFGGSGFADSSSDGGSSCGSSCGSGCGGGCGS